ncbi:Protein TRANSPARENT TESTA 12 [Acorus calamus]|uniref:Protein DETOXIFICATION n=1 Tax=Acorus calamus TaxID=4465 RepID=A0AAV9ETR5_ACOCL|nr:Protein TRANSPARENT TESTA 12 [Acorus calamus]
MDRVEEAVGGRRSGYLYEDNDVWAVCHIASVHRPHREHRDGGVVSRLPHPWTLQHRRIDGHVKWSRDPLRPGLRRETIPHAQHLPPTFVAHRARRIGPHHPSLHLQRTNTPIPRPNQRHISNGQYNLSLVHPHISLLCVLLHPPNVPPNAKQEHDHHLARRRITSRPRDRLVGSIHKDSSGLAGVMVSMIVSNWIPVVGQLVFVFYGGCPKTWTGFSVQAFFDLWPVIKLSLSSGVMLCLEIWYNAALILLTGTMEDAETSINALSVCLNINGWELMLSFGFLAAAGVRVSNELGKGSSKAAKFAIVVVVCTSLAIGIVIWALVLVFRHRMSYIFSNSAEVANATSHLSVLLAFSLLLNSVQPVLSGVAVGAGWQGTVAYVNLICYYVVGLPLGILFGFVGGYKVKGIWLGMICGTAVQTLVLSFLTWRTDWEKQVSLAKLRVHRWSIPRNKESDANVS